MKPHSEPAQFVPVCPADFIGHARRVAKMLESKATSLKQNRATADNVKLLLYGPPGVGKNRLAEMFGARLAQHRVCFESVNGRNVDVELVRRWQEEAHYIPITWTVKLVNELDTCPAAAQDLLLTYLDEIPGLHAFIGTSNLDLRNLERVSPKSSPEPSPSERWRGNERALPSGERTVAKSA